MSKTDTADQTPKGPKILEALLKGAIQSAAKVGDAAAAIEKAAGLSISLGVSREQFVRAMGQLAGVLYDTVAARRQCPAPQDSSETS